MLVLLLAKILAFSATEAKGKIESLEEIQRWL